MQPRYGPRYGRGSSTVPPPPAAPPPPRLLTPYVPLAVGKQQLLIGAYAKALEVIPRQVASNSGMDPTDVLNKLRMKHARGGKWFGVDVIENGVCDTFEAFVWEATVMKRNALLAATEAACLILSVDETVKNKTSKIAGADAQGGQHPGLQQGMPRR